MKNKINENEEKKHPSDNNNDNDRQQGMNDDAFDKDKNSNNSRSLAPDEWDLIYTKFTLHLLNATKRSRRQPQPCDSQVKEGKGKAAKNAWISHQTELR